LLRGMGPVAPVWLFPQLVETHRRRPAGRRMGRAPEGSLYWEGRIKRVGWLIDINKVYHHPTVRPHDEPLAGLGRFLDLSPSVGSELRLSAWPDFPPGPRHVP